MGKNLIKKLAIVGLVGTLLLTNKCSVYSPLPNFDNKDTKYSIELPEFLKEVPKDSLHIPYKFETKKKKFFLSQDSLNACIREAYGNVKKWPKEFDRRLYRLQLMQESGLNVYAKSHAGARGLSQIMPITWSSFRDSSKYRKDAFDPVKNIEVSLEYLNYLSKFCERRHPNWENLELEDKRRTILACYNGGQGTVENADWDLKSDELSRETKAYADSIMSRYHNPDIKIKTDY